MWLGLLNQLEFVGQEIRDEDFVQRSRSGALPRVLLDVLPEDEAVCAMRHRKRTANGEQ